MNDKHLVVALDVGTTKVCTIIGSNQPTGTEIIGVGSHPSYGLKKGSVVNIDKTVRSIRCSIEEAKQPKSIQDLVTPSEFIAMAIEFEDADDPGAAIQVYRAMSLAFGTSADICFRIAELLYQQSDLSGAKERYFMAVELDESFVEARASLGCVLVELDQNELARSAFMGALDHHADYPDVHFHLARLLDEMELSSDAQSHWQTFLELAPKSPWAEEARIRLGVED